MSRKIVRRDQLPIQGELEIQNAVWRAEGGEQQALPELLQVLEEHKVIWQEVGDMGQLALQMWTNLAVNAGGFEKDWISRQLADLSNQLGGPAPTLLECLLVHRVALTWLQVNYADASYAANKDDKNRDHLLRWQESAQQRHLQAVKAMAQVRKLLGPSRIAKSQQCATSSAPSPAD